MFFGYLRKCTVTYTRLQLLTLQNCQYFINVRLFIISAYRIKRKINKKIIKKVLALIFKLRYNVEDLGFCWTKVRKTHTIKNSEEKLNKPGGQQICQKEQTLIKF